MIRALALLCLLLSGLAQAQSTTYAPPVASFGNVALCKIIGANFNVTADQACVIPASITKWNATAITVTNCSTSMTLAAGGVYPTTAKGGTALVAATQVYSTLTSGTITINLTMLAAILATPYTVNTVYLSLTTGQGSAATCDFFVYGNVLQ
jgi:hypothetical protein